MSDPTPQVSETNTGKFHDGFGGEHLTRRQAENAQASEINNRERQGVNTFSNFDNLMMVLIFAIECFLFGVAYAAYKDNHYLYSVKYIAFAIIGLILGAFLFSKTMPSTRKRVYAIVGTVGFIGFMIYRFYIK